jgi:hypothetical protein
MYNIDSCNYYGDVFVALQTTSNELEEEASTFKQQNHSSPQMSGLSGLSEAARR